MKKEKGLVSLLMMYVMVPVLILGLICVDASRLIFAKQTIQIANDVVLENMMSHYNADLKRVYGLFASQKTVNIEEELINYWVSSVKGSVSQKNLKLITSDLIQKGTIAESQWQLLTQRKSSGSMTNLNGITLLQKPLIEPLHNSTLYNQDILKYQITEYMKYRGLISFSEHLLKKIGVIKGQKAPTLQQMNNVKQTEKQTTELEKLYKLQPLFKQVKTAMTDSRILNFESSKALLQQLQNEKDAKQVVKNSVEAMGEYQSKIVELQNALNHLEMESNALLDNVKDALEKEKQQLDEHRIVLKKIEFRYDASNLNNTNGQQNSKTVAVLNEDSMVKRRELENNTAFNQLTKEVGDNSHEKSLTQAVKEVYDKSKTTTDAAKITVPNGQNNIIESNDSLPNRKNVFSEAMSRLQNSVAFFTTAGSLPDLAANMANELLVMEYATEWFTHYLDREGANTPITKKSLLNGIPLTTIKSPTQGAEIEYLLFGRSNAYDNIVAARDQIKLIRFVFNLAYTYSSSELRTLIFSSSLIAGPFAKALDLFLHVIVALAETQMDDYLLMQGKAVPLVKTQTSFKMQPSQLATGALNFASDTITNTLHQGIDTVKTNVDQWFEKQGDNVEKNLNDYVNRFIQEQEIAVANKISMAVENVLQPLVSEQINAFEKNDAQLEERINKGFQTIEEKLFQQFNEQTMGDAVQSIVSIAKGKIQQLRKDYTTAIVSYIKTQQGNVSNVINDVIKRYVDQLMDPVRQKVSEMAKTYKEKALNIVKKETGKLSDKAKEELGQLTQNWLSTGASQLSTNTFVHSNQIVALTYEEHLKLMMLFELISNPKSPVYQRMTQMVAQNMKLDLSKYYTVYRVNSTYKVDMFIIDWFKQTFRAEEILGY